MDAAENAAAVKGHLPPANSGTEDVRVHVHMSPQEAENLDNRVDVDIDTYGEQNPPPDEGEGGPEGRAGATRRKSGKKAPLTPEEQAKRKKRTRRTALRLTLKILIYPVIAYLVLTLVIGVYQIHDNDMFPSLRDGDLVITYKLVEGYFTGDVVIYEAQGKTHVGRICAVAGDEVYIMEDGYYELNGSIPHEDIYYPTRSGKGLSYPYKVKEGEVFILGDMRLQATDSRALGAIPIEQLKGKVVLLLFRGRGF